jgi:superoxide reductase
MGHWFHPIASHGANHGANHGATHVEANDLQPHCPCRSACFSKLVPLGVDPSGLPGWFFWAMSCQTLIALYATSLPTINVTYTADNLGVHQARKGTHLPKIELLNGKVKVTTPHGSSEEHFIVRHTLLLADGTLLGAKVFTAKDKPVSEYSLPAGYKGKVYATSFCNLHDLWLAEASVRMVKTQRRRWPQPLGLVGR